MSFNDTIDGLTGRQIKRVQALTGESIQGSSDIIGLIFATAYVKQLHPEQVKNWGPAEVAGFDEYLDNTSYKTAAAVTDADSTVDGPKAEQTD